MPINTASRCYLVPEWLAQTRDPARRAWNVERYAHVPLDREGPVSSRYKFPKEHKPSVGDVARDITLLLLLPEEAAEWKAVEEVGGVSRTIAACCSRNFFFS